MPDLTQPDLTQIVKAYDVRGVVPDQLNAEVAEALGRVAAVELHGEAVVVGRDIRPSSVALAKAFMAGVRAQGLDTVDVGLPRPAWSTTPPVVSACPARCGRPSHNPAEYNGLKLCRAGAEPVSMGAGLSAIRDRAQAGEFPTGVREGGHRTAEEVADQAAAAELVAQAFADEGEADWADDLTVNDDAGGSTCGRRTRSRCCASR